MRVLIVGSGYIGLPLGAELARRGHNVSALRRTQSAAEELKARGLTPLFADITQPDQLAKLPREFDWVVNCVASGGGGADEYRQVYVNGMQNLLDWLAPTPQSTAPPRFIYTSSTSVYGQNDGSTVDEKSSTDPVAETSRILSETEKVLLTAAQQKNFPAMILRVAGIYGPDRGYWLKQFLNDEARMDGNGARILNMIHREDVIGCIIAALERGKPGEIYNAVDDEPVSQLEFFAWLAAALNKPLPASAPGNTEARKRGVTSKHVSNRKLKTDLGYRFEYPTFREGYAREIERQ